MKKIVMAVAVAAMVAGCSMAAPEHRIGKDWGECLKRGIIDPQNCDAAYDGGFMDSKAPAPVVVAQRSLSDILSDNYEPAPEPLYEPAPSLSDRFMQEGETLRRDLEIEDQGRRLRNLEQEQYIERFNRSLRPYKY